MSYDNESTATLVLDLDQANLKVPCDSRSGNMLHDIKYTDNISAQRVSVCLSDVPHTFSMLL